MPKSTLKIARTGYFKLGITTRYWSLVEKKSNLHHQTCIIQDAKKSGDLLWKLPEPENLEW